MRPHAPVVIEGELIKSERIEQPELPQDFQDDEISRAPLISILDLEGEAKTFGKTRAGEDAHGVNALSSRFGEDSPLCRAHEVSIQAAARSPNHLRMVAHGARDLADRFGQRDFQARGFGIRQTRISERHAFQRERERRSTAAICPQTDALRRKVGQAGERPQDLLLHRMLRFKIARDVGAQKAGQREHSRVFP